MSTFDHCGLILCEEEGPWHYTASPLNSDTFATTGGDGVHSSFLVLPGRDPSQFPIVMAVPMNDLCNVIVGENLIEFLCLGCRTGYFCLEQLVYERIPTIRAIEAAREFPADEVQAHLLRRLCLQFGLKP